MEDTRFRQLLDRFGFYWAGYRRVRKGVKKRIVRHMHQLQCWNIDEYIEAIAKDREKRLQFERLMTVSISRFFRDIRLWEIIHEEILPLLAQKSPRVIKVWSAGCASGEEVYSFKILWEDLRKSYPDISDIYIYNQNFKPVIN